MTVETPKYVLQKAGKPETFYQKHKLSFWLSIVALTVYMFGRYTNFEVLQTLKSQQKTLVTENQNLLAENEELRFQVSQWEVEAKVKSQAIKELQLIIEQNETMLSDLQSEIVFFENLLTNPIKAQGVHVFNIHVKETGSYVNLQVVLAQKITKAREKSGTIEMYLRGIKGESGQILNLTQLFDLTDRFQLKYFQIMNFGIEIPDDFRPTELIVKTTVKGDKPLVTEETFIWSDILNS